MKKAIFISIALLLIVLGYNVVIAGAAKPVPAYTTTLIDDFSLSGVISDKGEIVYIDKEAGGFISSSTSIVSSLRGELLKKPFIRSVGTNNKGEVVYSSGYSGNVGVWRLDGELIDFYRAIGSNILDKGEVVYEKFVGDYRQIYSNERGQLTFDETHHFSASANNRGEVVWYQRVGDYNQIFSNKRGQITFDNWHCENPSINDKGEIIWRTSPKKLYSSVYGELPISGVGTPLGVSHNNKGQILIFTLEHKLFLANPTHK